MAEKVDPKEIVTLEELAIANMWETSALVELLERIKSAPRLRPRMNRWLNPRLYREVFRHGFKG